MGFWDFVMEYVDEDIIYNPAYWFISVIFILAVIIGLRGSLLWDLAGVEQEYAVPLFWQIIIIFFIPIAAYFVIKVVDK